MKLCLSAGCAETRMTDLIIVGDEEWTVEELIDAALNPRCEFHCQGGYHKVLTAPQIRELRRRYDAARPGRRRGTKYTGDLVAIASDFGVSVRTLRRYVA